MPERFATTTDSSPGNRRLRFELILASVLFAVGLFLMPALIFWIGILVLGPYEATPGDGGMGSFYGDFFGDLATGEGHTWLLALGPLILVSLVRAVFIVKRPGEDTSADEPPPEQPSRPKATEQRRVEPSIGD